MRRFISLLAFAGALVFASPALAQLAPPPKLIVTKIDHVPMVELYDGGGGLPYLGSSTSYNAGDWENALRAYADGVNGQPPVYFQQVAQIDAIADQAIKKSTPHGWRAKLRRARAAGHGHGHGHGPKNYAIVFDV